MAKRTITENILETENTEIDSNSSIEDTSIEDIIKNNENRLKEIVTIRLFIDNDKYKEDVVVMHNGKLYVIKRGVDVQVPRYIADILKQSEEQDTNTARMIANYNRDFEGKAPQLL